MSFFIAADGTQHEVTVDVGMLREAADTNMSLPQVVNKRFGAPNAQYGTPWRQIVASAGFLAPGADHPYGFRSPTVRSLLEGELVQAAVGQGGQSAGRNQFAGGNESRILFPSVVIEMAEAALHKDFNEDANNFERMLALSTGQNGDNFTQPIITYETLGGPGGTTRARPQRVAQWAEPAAMLRFATSDLVRKVPTTAFGMEFTYDSLKTTTLDVVTLTLTRALAEERMGRVYEQISDLWIGDNDINIGAITGTTTAALDSSAASGTMTHKAWVKWLRRSRVRKINWAICDIDTYLKVEGRLGRPGIVTAKDSSLPTIDPQALAVNPYAGETVNFFIVDSAAEGGPVPANTIWGVDSRFGIVRVTNTEANYQATEQFAMRKTEALRFDTGSLCYRNYDQAFDVLTIS